MTRRAIILDANILIRAVLGQRVRELVMNHSAHVSFVAPDDAFGEARQYLPDEDQYALLSNYENSEYTAELAKLRTMAEGD